MQRKRCSTPGSSGEKHKNLESSLKIVSTATSAASLIVGVLLVVIGFFVLLFALLAGAVSGAVGAFIGVFAILFLAGGALLIAHSQQRPAEAKPAVAAVPSPSLQPPPGTVTRVIQPGTIAITPPSGGTITVSAWLQAPGGAVPITRLPQTFGRDDFRGIVPPHLLDAISRRHFTIGYDYVKSTFVVWDEGSTNGTYVNGVDIRGKGPVALRYGDIIAPANVVQLRFAPSAT
jgi:hypothetical protein